MEPAEAAALLQGNRMRFTGLGDDALRFLLGFRFSDMMVVLIAIAELFQRSNELKSELNQAAA